MNTKFDFFKYNGLLLSFNLRSAETLRRILGDTSKIGDNVQFCNASNSAYK